MQEAVTQSKFSASWKWPATILVGGAVLTAIGYYNPFVPDQGHKVLGAQIAVLITIAALMSWSWRMLRRRGGRSHHVLAAVIALIIVGLVGTLRLRFFGDLIVWPEPVGS